MGNDVGRITAGIFTGGASEVVRAIDKDAGKAFSKIACPQSIIADTIQKTAKGKNIGRVIEDEWNEATSKDGYLTNAVEVCPGGGFITAPVHAAAGNYFEAGFAAGGAALDLIPIAGKGASIAAKRTAKRLAKISAKAKRGRKYVGVNLDRDGNVAVGAGYRGLAAGVNNKGSVGVRYKRKASIRYDGNGSIKARYKNKSINYNSKNKSINGRYKNYSGGYKHY